MSSASQLLRAVITASLAVSFIIAGPCDASSTTPCNQGKTELTTAPNACCCGVNCECGPDCSSGETQSSAPSETTPSKDSLRDLAKIATVLEFTPADVWAVLQPDLKAHSYVVELLAHAPTLLAQHTCLQV